MYQNSFIQYFANILHKTLLPGCYKLQTFTYFIPSPPSRKTGYQEKKFDSITQVISNSGLKIIKLSTQSLSTEKSSGMWVNLVLKANTIQGTKVDLSKLIDDLEFITQETEVEGVYQLDIEEGQQFE